MSRRLALLSAELAATRDGPAGPGDPDLSWTDGHTRIRPARDPATRPPEAPRLDPRLDPPMVPTPGRHASRRAGKALAATVPATLRGRVAVGPAQLSVVALLVAAALALTCWWVIHDDSAPVPAPGLQAPATPLVSVPPGDASPVASEPTSPDATGARAGTVTVDVEGKVRRPGIAVLDTGARVVDALDAAGGARRGADLSGLNLARVLVDGEQIVVGQPAPAGVAASAVPSPGAAAAVLVNLNTATLAELETLPEVGPVTATSIVSWRDEHGGFTAVEELLEVDGIGDATLAKLAPYVTL